MDVQTMWTAARGAAVAATLLVHGTPQPPALLPAPRVVDHGALPAELLHHVPATMSIDQALATMHR